MVGLTIGVLWLCLRKYRPRALGWFRGWLWPPRWLLKVALACALTFPLAMLLGNVSQVNRQPHPIFVCRQSDECLQPLLTRFANLRFKECTCHSGKVHGLQDLGGWVQALTHIVPQQLMLFFLSLQRFLAEAWESILSSGEMGEVLSASLMPACVHSTPIP